MIVETEAYLGPHDLASHARFGPTARTSVMFGPGGVSYVYLCYGIHQMFNIVTGSDGEGQAVLIRAIAPLVGLADDPNVGRGPGKVTKALGLDRSHDRKDLATGPLFVARRRRAAGDRDRSARRRRLRRRDGRTAAAVLVARSPGGFAREADAKRASA